jgi:hypothetical protein
MKTGIMSRLEREGWRLLTKERDEALVAGKGGKGK